jgi:NAD(P)-dependent dehydrogenase (short-subunit alcohol dehydrogenase family)
MKGKVALVTGANSGIGKAAAKHFAREGAKVGLLGRNAEEIQQCVDEIKREKGEALEIVADVSEPGAMQAGIKKLLEHWGRLDIIVANAGINGVWTAIEDLDPNDWDETLDTNLKGTFLTVKYAVPHMKQNGGSIIVVSSVNGTRIFSNTGATAYACSKAGQVAFAKMVALELAKHRIRVNVICPGAIDTEIHDKTKKENLEAIKEPVEFPEGAIPLTDGKQGTSDQVADLIFFLASDASSHISGTEVWIDGAQSLLQG